MTKKPNYLTKKKTKRKIKLSYYNYSDISVYSCHVNLFFRHPLFRQCTRETPGLARLQITDFIC